MNNKLHLCILPIGLLASCLASCGRQPGSNTAGGRPKTDPLLGKWVMIADNGGGGNGDVADFRADGTVVVTHKGKQVTAKYKREPGSAWVARRMSGPHLGTEEALAQWKKPGVEMVEFAGPDGKYEDYGSSLLTLDPEQRILYNILTQLWCRPEDEARVKAEHNIQNP